MRSFFEYVKRFLEELQFRCKNFTTDHFLLKNIEEGREVKVRVECNDFVEKRQRNIARAIKIGRYELFPTSLRFIEQISDIRERKRTFNDYLLSLI